MTALNAIHWGPATKAEPKQLVVLCHGVGADAYDLIDIAPAWGEALPDAIFASVDAPFPHVSGFGRQWWEVGNREPVRMEAGVRHAATFLNAFIDAELERLGLPTDAYAMMGFSQGATTALFTGLRRPIAPRAILAYSGRLIAPESFASEIVNRAPVLLAHGEMDEVVAASNSREAAALLRALGVPVETSFSPRLGHGIDDTGIAIGGLTLQRGFSV